MKSKLLLNIPLMNFVIGRNAPALLTGSPPSKTSLLPDAMALKKKKNIAKHLSVIHFQNV